MSAYRDKTILGTFAKIAADEYLGKNKTSLNESLKKIATQENLTPHQLEYVVAEANKSVWSRLFAMDKTASYDFPLADLKAILGDLQEVRGPSKVSGADLDYLSPPSSTKVASFDPFEALGVQENALEKSAAARKEVKRQLQARFEKLSSAKEELERLMFVADSDIQSLELKFVKEARDLVCEIPFTDRNVGVEKVAEFLRGCGRPEHGTRLMAKLSHVLTRQGLVKKADLKAPEEYISSTLPAQIINGNHSLYMTIQTLFDRYDDRFGCERRYEIVDSSLPVIREKIRAL
jgi:hypothetical protein